MTLDGGEKCNPSVHTHTLLSLFVLSQSSTTLFYVRNACWTKGYKKNQQVHIAFVKNSVVICDPNEIIISLPCYLQQFYPYLAPTMLKTLKTKQSP